MKGAGKSWKHERGKSLSQLHLSVAASLGRRQKKSYFREFQLEKQLSFFPLQPTTTTAAAAGIIFPRDFGPGTITSLSKIRRRKSSLGGRENPKETVSAILPFAGGFRLNRVSAAVRGWKIPVNAENRGGGADSAATLRGSTSATSERGTTLFKY